MLFRCLQQSVAMSLKSHEILHIDKHKEHKLMESQYNQAKELYYLERYEEALIILYEIPEYTGSTELTAKAEAQLELRIQKERLQAEYEIQLAEEARRAEILGMNDETIEPYISEQIPYVGMDETFAWDWEDEFDSYDDAYEYWSDYYDRKN